MPFPFKESEASDAAVLLRRSVEVHMSDADDMTIRIVTAIIGLLATVAYADRVFAVEESAHIRSSIDRIHGMPSNAADTICDVLGTHLGELAALHSHTFTRQLKELTEPSVRMEILDVLVDLAASDGVISLPEVTELRQITTQLGLSQHDYNASQARHRDKLSFLS